MINHIHDIRHIVIFFTILNMLVNTNAYADDSLPRVEDIEKAIGKGWECNLAPNGLNPPGSVYRLDENNILTTVNDHFSKEFKVKETPISIPVIKKERKQKASFFLALFSGIVGKLTNADISASIGQKYNTTAYYKNATIKDTTDVDTGREKVKKWYASYTDRDSKSKYFLVRSVVSAEEVFYEIDKDYVNSVGGEANFEKIISGSANVTTTGNSLFKLEQKLSSQINVCIKPERLKNTSAAMSGQIDPSTVKLEELKEPLQIEEVILENKMDQDNQDQ